jgi:uncharacterized protein (TIGR02265 family)
MKARSTAKRADTQGYERPNFRAALIVDTYVTGCSPQATSKGFYASAFLREATSNGQHLEGYGPYRDFKDYPQQENIRLIAECARRLYPDEPLREGIRRIGWSVFPILLSTMIGKVVFGALGDNIPAVVRMTPRGFEVSLNQGRCEVLHVAENEAELCVSDCYLFPDCFFVGVFEGALAHYGRDAQILVRNAKAGSCEYLARW